MDVVRLLDSKLGMPAQRVEDAEKAVAAARSGDAVLLLADGCPSVRTSIPINVALAARERRFRAYVEFPASDATADTLSWNQQAVVSSSKLEAHGFDQLRIPQRVAVNWCGAGRCAATRNSSVCANACNDTFVSFAQVAGVDRAVLGLEQRGANAAALRKRHRAGPARGIEAEQHGLGALEIWVALMDFLRKVH